MARDDVLVLSAGGYDFEICPTGGGCMTSFRYDGIDILRPATNEYWQRGEPRASASYPLMPFSNRIADGRADFDGRSYQFPINMPPEPHSIHGDGWKASWNVEEATSTRAVLSHAPADPVLSYHGRQIFELAETGLTARLEITNTDDHRLPLGFGHHPYFPRTEGLTLEMTTSHVWMPDERKIPSSRVAVPAAWNFAAPQRLAPLDLDHHFTGGDGRMTMYWPETALRLTIHTDSVFGHVVVFVPPGRDYVCVEPVSHVANAINLANAGIEHTGLQVLDPGDTLRGEMRFIAETR